MRTAAVRTTTHDDRRFRSFQIRNSFILNRSHSGKETAVHLNSKNKKKRGRRMKHDLHLNELTTIRAKHAARRSQARPRCSSSKAVHVAASSKRPPSKRPPSKRPPSKRPPAPLHLVHLPSSSLLYLYEKPQAGVQGGWSGGCFPSPPELKRTIPLPGVRLLPASGRGGGCRWWRRRAGISETAAARRAAAGSSSSEGRSLQRRSLACWFIEISAQQKRAR